MTTLAQPRTAPRSSEASRTKRRNQRLVVALSTVLIALAVLATLIPIYFVVVAAFNPTGSLSTSSALPRGFTLDNFVQLFADPTIQFGRWFVNSMYISVTVTVVVTFVVAMSAYAFSRLRFRGRENILMTIVLLQVFPNILAIVAIFLLVNQLGTITPLLGLNSHLTLILVYVGGAIGGNVWLLKAYMDSIPKELDESATIDGASHWVIFSGILFPLVRPMLAVVAVLTFTGAYSEILIMQVLVRDSAAFTLPLGLYTMSVQQYTIDWGLFAAGAMLAALPPLVLFYISQKWLITGLTQGAVKS
jgi:arabinogalactan oligomer/maltooligosaccharide transport system permease protein